MLGILIAVHQKNAGVGQVVHVTRTDDGWRMADDGKRPDDR
jgi:hypothetical protein